MKALEPRSVSEQARWILNPRVVTGLLIFLGLVALASAITSIGYRNNDFFWHYRIGLGALQGGAYQFGDGQTVGEHYPIGRLWMNGLAALLPSYRLSRAVIWLLGIAMMALALRAIHRMANVQLPVQRDVAWVAGLLSVIVMLPLIFRDLDDCGLQLIMLGMLCLGGLAVVQRRVLLAGFWIGLAITYKTTPLLFLGYLIYKRRWLESLSTVGFILIFNLVIPVAWFGFNTTLQGHQKFFNTAYTALQIKDPSDNPVEPPKHQNFSLKYAISRYLMTFPPEHTLYLAQRDQKDENQKLMVPVEQLEPATGFYQFLDLPPTTANKVVNACLLVLALLLAWRFRRSLYEPKAADKNDENANAPPPTRAVRNIAPEWAVVTMLCALLSPLTWKHHMVLALPTVFLLFRSGLVWPNPWYRDGLMWLAIATWLPLRELVGRHNSVVLASYNLMTAGMLVLMALVLTLPTNLEQADRRAASAKKDDSIDR